MPCAASRQSAPPQHVYEWYDGVRVSDQESVVLLRTVWPPPRYTLDVVRLQCSGNPGPEGSALPRHPLAHVVSFRGNVCVLIMTDAS